MPEPVTTPTQPVAAAAGAGNEGSAEGKLDAILGHVKGLHAKHDALCTRMDAVEAKVHGNAGDHKEGEPAAAVPTGEPVPPTSIAADAGAPPFVKKEEVGKEPPKETPKEPTAMADSANAATLAEIRKSVADLGKRIPVPVAEADRKLYVEAQMRCEKVAQSFADSAPAPMQGESLMEYRVRLATPYKTHSPRWKDIELAGMTGALLDQVEAQVYADAMAAAINPAAMQPGVLIEVKETDRANRTISRFKGDPEACWGRFKAQPRFISGVTTRFGHGL